MHCDLSQTLASEVQLRQAEDILNFDYRQSTLGTETIDEFEYEE